MCDPDSFLGGGSSSNLIHQHQRSGSGETCERTSRYSRDGGFGHGPSIMAQLAISFANVLKLFSMSSSFESRESRQSCVLHKHQRVYLTSRAISITYLKLAYSAGTKHPHIPMIVSSPTCRRYVLFPVRVNVMHQGERYDLLVAVMISHKPT
jgi:hypothetical protein